MGNHDVGRALAGAADGFWDGRETATKEQALAFLDKVAERWRGAKPSHTLAIRVRAPRRS